MDWNKRDWVKRKTGGVGFIIKRDLECKRISCDSEDICFIKLENMIRDMNGF